MDIIETKYILIKTIQDITNYYQISAQTRISLKNDIANLKKDILKIKINALFLNNNNYASHSKIYYKQIFNKVIYQIKYETPLINCINVPICKTIRIMNSKHNDRMNELTKK